MFEDFECSYQAFIKAIHFDPHDTIIQSNFDTILKLERGQTADVMDEMMHLSQIEGSISNDI